MARKARCSFISNVYHLMVQGDEKKRIFDLSANKRKYLYFLKHDAFRNDVDIISYCMMDNHAHVLVYCPEIERISQMMHECNTSYAIFYNKKRNKVGHVFRDRFKSETIFTKSHLMNCIRYIHENPVKAGICISCDEYGFSSYKEMNQIRKEVLNACGLTKTMIQDLINHPHTDDKYMDNENQKTDLMELFQRIQNQYHFDLLSKKGFVKMYIKIKTESNETDKAIADFFQMDRNQLYRLLKEAGLK